FSRRTSATTRHSRRELLGFAARRRPARGPARRAVGGLFVVLALFAAGHGPLPSTVDRDSAAPSRVTVCGPVVRQPRAEPPWGLRGLRPDLAWPLTRGAGVRVAVIDSGVSDNHASLRGKVLPGIDYVSPGAGPGPGWCDENGHGTLIAGIIAGRE